MENQRGLRIRCQEWLKPLNVKAIHERQIESRLAGTCRWIWTNPDFMEWSKQPSPQASDRVLCIYGPPGCGKSVLASSIVEGFQMKKFTTLFYSFSGMDADRQSTNRLICTFLWQLIQDSSDERRLDIVLNLMRNGPPGTDELWDTLKELVALAPGQVYCIIDGTDECSDPTSILLDHICELLATCESTYAILLSRPRELQNTLSTTPNAIEINPETIKHDIDKFVDTKIRESTIPCLPGDLGDTVSQTLKSNSDGMFLWAKLMIDELSRSSTAFHVRERLRNLPRGLEEAYRHLLLQLLKRLDPLDISLVQRVLAFTTAACRTLSIKEVQYACALESLSISANSTLDDHMLLHPEKTIFEVCGDFISIRDGLVRFVHFSVKEFLTRPESEWSSDDDRRIASFRVDVEGSHLRLGSTCLDFLTTGGYPPPSGDASYEGVMARYPFLKYASIYMITHLGQYGMPCPATLARLWSFMQSEKCITWIEYAGVIQMENSSFEMLAEDLERISLWPGGEQLVCLSVLFEQELARRVREFGEHDRCTDRWRLILDTFQLKPAPAIQQSELATNSAISDARWRSRTTPQDLAQIIDGLSNNLTLPLDRQVNMILRLQSYLSQVNALTDPLKMLFRVVLQSVSAVPIYGLILIADFYQRVNKLEESLEVYDAALKKTEGQEVRTRHYILDRVSGILKRQGKVKDAEATYRRAFEEGKKVWGVDHPNTLTSAHLLAGVLYSQDMFGEAEALYRRILTGRERIQGTDHLDTLASADNLANALYGQSKFPEAEILLRRTLAGREKALGPEHRDTLVSANNLANVLYGQGKFAEAVALYQRALTKGKVLGANHHDHLVFAGNLEYALRSQGNFAEAEALCHAPLTGAEKVLGANQCGTLVFANSLGYALRSQGKFVEAQVLHQIAFTGAEMVLGAGHRFNLAFANSLGHALRGPEKFSEAEIPHQRPLTGEVEALGHATTSDGPDPTRAGAVDTHGSCKSAREGNAENSIKFPPLYLS